MARAWNTSWVPAQCPCSSGLPYDSCCGPFHRGQPAPTAERLMRSRYSAFALRDTAYLLRTWHPSTRPPELELDPRVQWSGLRIVGRTGGSLLESTGTVEFSATYRVGGQRNSQDENSRFVKQGGQWFYLGPV